MRPAGEEKYRKSCGALCARSALILAVVLASVHAQAPVQARMTDEVSGGRHTVALIARGQVACLSVTDFCEGLGFTWKWDFSSQKLTCTKKGVRLSFVEGMPFYLVNDSLRQLAAEPVRDGGMLYLAAAACGEVFSSAAQESIVWHGEDSTIVVSPPVPAAQAMKPAEQESAATVKTADTAKKAKSPAELVKTVVLDPGHGGMDPGAVGPTGLDEKKVVLDIALILRDLIKKKTKLTVYLTRETDRFIPLVDRTRFANEKKADIFVSIHANSIEGNQKKKDATRGYKVYFLSQAKNEDDKMVAMRENAVIKLEDNSHKYDNLQDILIEMAGNEYLRESQDLSIMIAETFSSTTQKIPRLHLGVGQANFWVLNGTYMPSVLIEIGFISSSQEEKELADAGVQKTIAAGIFDAIMSFKKKYEAGL